MKKTRCKLPDEIKDLLIEVSEEEILRNRLSGELGVVLKIGTSYYAYNFVSTDSIAKEEEKEKIRHVLGRHLCGSCNFHRNGKLCPKVADFSVETCKRYYRSKIAAMKESKRIEKYPFVTSGIECFNSPKEYFVVTECTRYQAQLHDRNQTGDSNS